jgi:hypothetical protein
MMAYRPNLKSFIESNPYGLAGIAGKGNMKVVVALKEVLLRFW